MYEVVLLADTNNEGKEPELLKADAFRLRMTPDELMVNTESVLAPLAKLEAVIVPEKVLLPATASVLLSAAAPATERVLLKVEAPDTLNVLLNVVAPVTAKVPPTAVLPLKVLFPAMVWAPVVITPRAVADASGRLNVWVVPEDDMAKLVPLAPVANVCELPDSPFILLKNARLTLLLATPLMVELKLVPLKFITFELMILTFEPVTPLTEVLRLFAELVLLIEFTICTPELVCPFTVVDITLLALDMLIEFTAVVLAETPFTTLVMVFTELLMVCVVEPPPEVESADQEGDAAVPVFKSSELVLVLKMISPFAGKGMAFRCVVVIRGARNPLIVLLTSSMALVSG